MKTYRMTRIAIPALALIAWLLAPQTAHCFYNASTGRWLSRDPEPEAGSRKLRPIGSRVGLSGSRLLGAADYVFTINSPVNHTDKLGLFTQEDRQKLCSQHERDHPEDFEVPTRAGTTRPAGGIPVCFNGEVYPCLSSKTSQLGWDSAVVNCLMDHEKSHAEDLKPLCKKCTLASHVQDPQKRCPTCESHKIKPIDKQHWLKGECKANKAQAECLKKLMVNDPRPVGWLSAIGIIEGFLKDYGPNACPNEFPDDRIGL